MRAERALCGRCARVVRARVSASAHDAQDARGRVPPPRPVGLYRPARGAVSPSGRGRRAKRGRERTDEPTEPRARRRSEASRAHEGEGGRKERADRTSPEGVASGAPAGAEGGGYP